MNTTSTQTTNITKKDQSKLKFDDSKHVIEHLEYLGYTIEKLEDPINDVIYADGTYKPLITVTISKDWIQFIAKYGPYEMSVLSDIDFYIAINKINKGTAHTIWYMTVNSTDTAVSVGVYATYRKYDRISFGNFVTRYELEINENLETLPKRTK